MSVLLTGKVAVPVKLLPDKLLAVRVALAKPLALTKLTVPKLAGMTSTMRAPVTAVGPRLATVSVNKVVAPSARVGVLAAFVIDRSVVGPITTLAVATLLLRFASVMVLAAAMLALLIALVADAPTACKTMVIVLPTGSVTVPVKVVIEAMLVAPMLAPPATLELTQVSVPKPAGSPSITVELVPVCGPELVSVKVNCVVWPALMLAGLAVLLMPRLACGKHL